MNRQSLPKEVDAPDLNDRGLYVFHGCDTLTSQRLKKLAKDYRMFSQLPYFLDENGYYPPAEYLYILTEDDENESISHAVAHVGMYGLSMYSFRCSEEDEQAFRRLINSVVPIDYS